MFTWEIVDVGDVQTILVGHLEPAVQILAVQAIY